MSSSSEDKEIVRRLFNAFYAVDSETMQDLLSPEFVGHSMPPGFSRDREGFLEMARQYRAAFSDDETTLDELLAAEDGKVITRFTTHATHSGDAFGIPASNRTVTMTGIEIYALAKGKVTDLWVEMNMSELFNPSEASESMAGGSA